ncbi:hypothetical protein VTI28DRAFT_295 [Corynascus sepedonium]
MRLSVPDWLPPVSDRAEPSGALPRCSRHCPFGCRTQKKFPGECVPSIRQPPWAVSVYIGSPTPRTLSPRLAMTVDQTTTHPVIVISISHTRTVT